MKLFKRMKDGGAESSVTGYWLIESKRFFSIVLLRFEGASREAYHEHAFDSISWLLRGHLRETMLGNWGGEYKPSIVPILTLREDFHKVDSLTPVSWVLSFRGPWRKNWKEYLPHENRYRTLAAGRVEVPSN